MPDTAPATPFTGGTADKQSVMQAAADLLQMVVDYLRQEAESLVRDKVAAPIQNAGLVVAFAMAAAFLLALGLAFIAVAGLIALAGWLGWPLALLIIGVVLVAGAAGFTAAKFRRMKR